MVVVVVVVVLRHNIVQHALSGTAPARCSYLAPARSRESLFGVCVTLIESVSGLRECSRAQRLPMPLHRKLAMVLMWCYG